MKIVTWNINSVRARLERLLDWLEAAPARRALPAGAQVHRRAVPARRGAGAGYRAERLRPEDLQRRGDPLEGAGHRRGRGTWATATSRRACVAGTVDGRPRGDGSTRPTARPSARRPTSTSSSGTAGSPVARLRSPGRAARVRRLQRRARRISTPGTPRSGRARRSSPPRSARRSRRCEGRNSLIDLLRHQHPTRAASSPGGTTAPAPSRRTRGCASITSWSAPPLAARCPAVEVDSRGARGQAAVGSRARSRRAFRLMPALRCKPSSPPDGARVYWH